MQLVGAGSQAGTGRKKWPRSAGALLLAALLLLAAWWQVSRPWEMAIPPPPPPPRPNADDFYLRAHRAYVKPESPVDRVHDRRPPDPKRRYSPAARRAWLVQNTRALHLVRQGFRYQCLVPREYNFRKDISGRDLAWLLVVESREYGARGRWGRAASSCLNIIRIGYDLSRGGALINHMFGNAFAAFGARYIRPCLPHLSGQDLRTAAARLESLYASRFPLTSTLQEYKWYVLDSFQKSLKESPRGWRLSFALADNSWKGRLRAMTISRRGLLRITAADLDRHIAASRYPYPRRPVVPQHSPLEPLPRTALHDAPFFEARSCTSTALLFTEMAVRSYRLEHGTYPPRLQELVPRYLRSVPTDRGGLVSHYITQ